MYFRQILVAAVVSLFVSAILAEEHKSDVEARLVRLLEKAVARTAQENRILHEEEKHEHQEEDEREFQEEDERELQEDTLRRSFKLALRQLSPKYTNCVTKCGSKNEFNCMTTCLLRN